MKMVRDNRGAGSKWRDSSTGQWTKGPLPSEGTVPQQGIAFDVPDIENPPEFEGWEWLYEWDIEVEARGEGT